MGLTWGLVPVMLLMDLLTPPMPAGLEKQRNDEASCCQELFSTPADVKKTLGFGPKQCDGGVGTWTGPRFERDGRTVAGTEGPRGVWGPAQENHGKKRADLCPVRGWVG